MNKEKGIIIGILALIVTMMVGYAIFSETITINGTATAKGNFDLTYTCISGVSDELSSSGLSFLTESGYKNDSCNILDNVITFNASLEYPTARRYFTIKVVNTGTITAIDESVDVVTQMLTNGSKNCQYNSSDNTQVRCIAPNVSDINNSGYKYIKKDKDGIVTVINNRDKLTLDPGDTFYLILGITWPSQFQSNTFKSGYYFELTRNYVLDFVQQTK